MKIYDTVREKEELNLIKSMYKDVVNPNGDIRWRGTMDDYYQAVRESEMVICSEYQGHIGRGVYTEIEEAKRNDIPVVVIRQGKFYPVKDIRIEDSSDWGIKYGRID